MKTEIREAAALRLVMVAMTVVAVAMGAHACLAAKAEGVESGSQTQMSTQGEIGVYHGKLNTDDPEPVDPGHVEIGLGYAYGAGDHEWDNSRNLEDTASEHSNEVGVGLTVGIVPNVDANIALGYAWVHDGDFELVDGAVGPTSGSNLGDTSVGARWRFWQNEDLGLQVAYLGGFTIPTGSHCNADHIGTTQGFWSLDQSLVATRDWGRFTANAQLGYSLPFGGDRCDERGTLIGNLACGYQARTWLQPEAELNYEQGFVDDGSGADVLSATVGLLFPLSEHWTIKTGMKQALTGRNADRTTTGIVSATASW